MRKDLVQGKSLKPEASPSEGIKDLVQGKSLKPAHL